MAANWQDNPERAAGSPLSGDIGARVAAIVHAAEREAQAAERAIADRRLAAEEEVQRYLAAARLRVDAEAAARAARLEALGTAARRLAAELSDATSELTRELHRAEDEVATALPHTPWPAPPGAEHSAPAAAAPAPPAPEPTWTRNEQAASRDDARSPGEATAEPVEEPSGAGEQTPGASAVETPRVAHEPAEPQRDEAIPAPAANGTAGAQVPSAARLVAIEMAVGGSSRAEVERHLREQLGAADPQELLDDVFGPASHAGSTLAWGKP